MVTLSAFLLDQDAQNDPCREAAGAKARQHLAIRV
jgi:hypothetical protein